MNIRRLAIAIACLAVGACSTPADPGAYEAGVHALVKEGMPVGDAMLALQGRGYQCASTWDADRTIDCTRHQAHLTKTCIEHVGFVAPAKTSVVTGLLVPQPVCS
jgi:hypothetical protein